MNRIFLVLFLCGSTFVACKDSPKLPPLPSDAVVVAFGDSLTYGVGSKPEDSYPSVLRDLIKRHVVNAGVSGEETFEGMERLPKVLDRYNPSLVILCLGGNDFLRRRKPSLISDNLGMMLQTLQDRKVPVLLIAVPDLGIPGFLSDSDIYSELAEKYRVPLLEDKLSSLESRNKYKSDSIHLNAQGYRLLAEAIAAILKESGAI